MHTGIKWLILFPVTRIKNELYYFYDIMYTHEFAGGAYFLHLLLRGFFILVPWTGKITTFNVGYSMTSIASSVS